MQCDKCGLTIGQGTMGTVLPLCQCRWQTIERKQVEQRDALLIDLADALMREDKLKQKVEELQTAYDAAHSELVRTTTQLGACRGVAEERTQRLDERRANKWPFGDYAEPPHELVWLYSHCKAIGMECKSDSGRMEHDIALFTAAMTQEFSDFKENTIGVCATWKRDYEGEKERGDRWMEDCRASQAREQQLREALEAITRRSGMSLATALAAEALATPSDTAALDRACKLYAAGVLAKAIDEIDPTWEGLEVLRSKAAQLRKEAGE